MHIAISECIFAIPVSLIGGQLFGVKTHSCARLLYVCYYDSSPSTTQYIDISAIWSSEYSISPSTIV